MRHPGGRKATPVGRRRKRLDDDDIREAMIAAGRDYIQEMGGLSVSLEHLSYEDIMARSGVSRSSVYRVWQYKEDYFAELVPALASFEWMTGADPSHQEAMLDGLDELANQGESLADPEFRRAVAMEIAKSALNQALESPTVRKVWQDYLFAAAVLSSYSAPDGKQLTGSYDFEGEAHVSILVLEAALAIAGYRPRPGMDVLGFFKLAILLTEGYMARLLSDATPFDTTYTLDLGEGPTEVPLTAVALVAIFNQFFEADPEYDPVAARETYVATSAHLRSDINLLIEKTAPPEGEKPQ